MIAAIPKTYAGYACVTPRTERIWHGTGSADDSVAVIGTSTDCCKWFDIHNMFDSEGTSETFAYFDVDFENYETCDCHASDRFLTITLSKPTYVRSIKLKQRKSLLEDGSSAKYTNVAFEYENENGNWVEIDSTSKVQVDPNKLIVFTWNKKNPVKAAHYSIGFIYSL